MRTFTATILLFALTFQCVSQLGVLAYFNINRDYIAKVLCINRDKPKMHCDGKCYLKKKLKEADPDSKESAPVSTKSESFVAFILPQRCKAVLSSFHTETILQHFTGYKVHFPTAPAADIFHPPAVV